MAKRFTETKIWADPWFQELSLEHKTFWKYLCDNCGLAGEWPVNMALAQFQIGAEIDREKALRAFNAGKNRVIDYGKTWLLVDFVAFQYGRLRPNQVRFHAVVQSTIDRLSVTLPDTLPVTLPRQGQGQGQGHGIGQGQGKGYAHGC